MSEVRKRGQPRLRRPRSTDETLVSLPLRLQIGMVVPDALVGPIVRRFWNTPAQVSPTTARFSCYPIRKPSAFAPKSAANPAL